MQKTALARMGLLAALTLASVCAQSPREQSLNIGFKFTVVDKELPAGRYHFVHPNEASPWLVVRGAADNTKVQTS